MNLWDLFKPREKPAHPEFAEAQRRRDYVECFASPAGRRVLEDLCRRNHVVSYLANHLDGMGRLDPTLILVNEGRRSLAVEIARMADDKWAAMEIEARLHEEGDSNE